MERKNPRRRRAALQIRMVELLSRYSGMRYRSTPAQIRAAAKKMLQAPRFA